MNSPQPDPEPSTDADAAGMKRLVADVDMDIYKDLVRSAAEATIAEGQHVPVAEITRRRLRAAMQVAA